MLVIVWRIHWGSWKVDAKNENFGLFGVMDLLKLM